MAQMTIQVPDELNERLRGIQDWAGAILSLALVGFKTSATQTASEIIEFLSKKPTMREVADFHISDRAQNRLRRLLALNEAGLLGEEEQRELDEMEQIEHIMIMFKARAVQRERRPA